MGSLDASSEEEEGPMERGPSCKEDTGFHQYCQSRGK